MVLPRPGLLLQSHFWYIQDDANFFRGLAHERARHLKAGEVEKGFYGMERQGKGADSGLEKKKKKPGENGGSHSRIAMKFAAVTKSNNID